MDNLNTRLALLNVQEAYEALNRRFALLGYADQRFMLDEMIQLERTIGQARAQANRDASMAEVHMKLRGE